MLFFSLKSYLKPRIIRIIVADSKISTLLDAWNMLLLIKVINIKYVEERERKRNIIYLISYIYSKTE